MATLTGPANLFEGSTVEAHSTARHTLGTRAKDSSGNEYVYLRGTASTIAGAWVTFDLNGSTTTLATANGVGPVAVAGTATTTNLYGWYQVYGKNTIALADKAIAANKGLYLTAAAGYVDDADVAQDFIIGACSLAQSSGSAVTVWLNYPFVSDIALD